MYRAKSRPDSSSSPLCATVLGNREERSGKCPMRPLRAVYDDDLIPLLKNLGLLTKIERGRVRCKICREAVTLDTVHAMFPESGTIHIVCSKPNCITELINQHL